MEAIEKQEKRREPHIAVVETPERLAELYRKTGLFGDDVTHEALIDGLRGVRRQAGVVLPSGEFHL